MQSVAEIEASPEVQDLRNRVSAFLGELIYPNEKILEKGGEEASRTFKSIQAEAKKILRAAESALPLRLSGHRGTES